MKHIMITGASSGIGEALALEYAAPGITLSLTGRNPDRLNDIAKRCEALGANVHSHIIDVGEKETMAAWVRARDQLQPLDLAIANAGISGGSSASTSWEDSTHAIFDINVNGVLNTILPILPIMVERGRGQVALMSSLAGFRGLASSPAYSASKVGVKAYGEALRLRYRNDGVKVNVICPGFVRSRITDQNDFKMPMFMEAERAAKIIRQGLERNKAVIAFPGPMAIATRLFALLPLWVVELISARLPAKE